MVQPMWWFYGLSCVRCIRALRWPVRSFHDGTNESINQSSEGMISFLSLSSCSTFSVLRGNNDTHTKCTFQYLHINESFMMHISQDF
jgi:hypothetical protein